MQIVPATSDQMNPAAELLARAFHQDPGALLFYPSEARRAAGLKDGFRTLLRTPGLAVTIGIALGSKLPVACAAWLPPRTAAMSLSELVSSLAPLLRSPGAAVRMARAAHSLRRLQASCSPPEAWTLVTIGTDPTIRGRGAGGALLQQGLGEVIPEGSCCYLETLNANNVSWFRRAGFEVVGQIVPPGSMRTTAMVRNPA